MSVFDKFVAAVTPPESDEARMKARADAQAAAEPGDWLSMVLDHHYQLEAAFEAARTASGAVERTKAVKSLGIVLTGHANAEESVLYPALADEHKTDASMAYEEQATVKIEMALLEKLDPMSQDWLDKLEHIRGAVAHHMYEEEGDWFLHLKRETPAEDQAKLAKRYSEEFERYAADALV